MLKNKNQQKKQHLYGTVFLAESKGCACFAFTTLGDRCSATVPASSFDAKNSPPDCFLYASHPLRVRILFLYKKNSTFTVLFFWRRARDVHASHSPLSATVAPQQYPPQASTLKTVHRTVFFTRLTLSGFESLFLYKKNSTFTVLFFWRRARDSNPRNRFSSLHDFQSCSFDQLGQLSVFK